MTCMLQELCTCIVHHILVYVVQVQKLMRWTSLYNIIHSRLLYTMKLKTCKVHLASYKLEVNLNNNVPELL
jgi:hypothetical protein